MCDCHSYNWEVGSIPEVILPSPDWLVKPNGVCIDACIADLVRKLWDAGVHTVGSCCGHNKEPITIILAEDSPAQITAATSVLIDLDAEAEVLVWRLTPVTSTVVEKE